MSTAIAWFILVIGVVMAALIYDVYVYYKKKYHRNKKKHGRKQ